MIPEKKISPEYPLTSDEQKLLEIVDNNENEIVNLLQKLIRINSINKSEFEFCERNEIFKFAEQFMKEEGFNTTLYKAPFSSGKKNEFYYNLIATSKEDPSEKSLQFNGHLDIVPFNPDKWDSSIPPLGGVIKDGKIFGRGSMDMKAGIACQMMAMKLLKDAGVNLKGKLQLWLVPDEETHGIYGSAFMTKQHFDVVNCDATIISEPSSVKPFQSPAIAVGEKGPHWLKFTFFGVAGHGSMPKEHSNALNKAVRFMSNSKKQLKIPKVKAELTKLDFLKSLLSRFKLTDIPKLSFSTGEKKDVLDKDKISLSSIFETTYSFDKISAGTKTNVIPDKCELEVDFRVMPGLSTQRLFDSIVKYCSKLNYRIELPEGYTNLQHSNPKLVDEPVEIELSILTIGDGSFEDYNSEFGKTLANTFEGYFQSKVFYMFMPGFTDAGNMREAGMKDIYVIGPSGGHAHEAYEYADIDSLYDLTKFYMLLAYRYLSKI